MKTIHAIVMAFVITSMMPSYAQQHATGTDEQRYVAPEAYAVYSALLNNQSVRLSSHGTLVIRERTSNALLNVPSYPIDGCFSAEDRVQAEATQDFMRVNKQRWRLENKFAVTMPHRVSRDASQLFIEFSAVGFNATKDFAVVRLSVVEAKQKSGGLNTDGESDIYALRREQGRWRPVAHGCHSTDHTFVDVFQSPSSE